MKAFTPSLSLAMSVMTLVLAHPALSAQLVVLDDQGGRPFMLNGKHQRAGLRATPPRDIRFSIDFPVRTTRLSPGQMATTPTPLHQGQQPLFVIGNDDVSLDWIEVNKPYLLEIGARGFVVSVDTEQDWHQLREWLAPLDVKAVTGDAFHEVFGLTHYPFLLLNGEALQ
jgi:integrating conjugative element protein (TIGR03765 family)